MNVEIEHGPGNSIAHLTLAPSEVCVAEGGSMVAMSADTQITTTTHQKSGGGFLKGMKRMLGGESFFINQFKAGASGGDVKVAATMAGDMACVELANDNIIVQGGSFVACEESVTIDMSWQGFKSLFAKEAVFWLKASGPGKLVFNSFGAIYCLDVDGDYIVDTGHIVAFEETLDFKLSKAGKSWLSSILGGEGLVCRFQGRGKVWCQSHNSTAFGRILGPTLRPR